MPLVVPPPQSRIPKRYLIATVLQCLAPLSWSFGLWLIFPTLHITGNACLTCFSKIGAGITTSPTALTENLIGSVFFLVGFLLFASSLGMLASDNNIEALGWLRWLGRWRPVLSERTRSPFSTEKHRSLVLTSLVAGLFLAVLVIPGIGESRQFPLNQFFDLWGTIWYFYVFGIGVIGLILIYKRRVGGYFLSLIFCLIAIGMTVPDLLGLLPPQPPTLGTSLLLGAGLPFSALGVYTSWTTVVEIRE